ncbi:MAG TPA: tetratricopeptide repeat protein [Sphingomicrobium sp.]
MRTAILALAILSCSAAAFAQSAEDRFAAVNRLLAGGKTEEALIVLRGIAAAEPGNGRAHNALGSILNSNGHYPDALRHAEAAVAADPANGRYRYGYGVVLAEHGRFAEAVDNFDKAIAAHPEITYAWLERGAALLAIGDGAGAAADWARARDTAPTLIWTRWYPATGDFLAGRFAAAADAFDQVAKAESGFAPAPVWAWIAARRAGQATDLPKSSTKDWPAPVLDYFAGSLSGDQLLAFSASDQKSGDKRRVGEAHFFMGQKALIDGQPEAARDHFLKAVAVQAPRHVWKLAAERELKRLGE